MKMPISFYPHVFINDEPEWNTAHRAEYRCICNNEQQTDQSTDTIFSSTSGDEYFTLEPMTKAADGKPCICDPMWYTLTCDAERFKKAISCENDQCDGLIRKLKTENNKFKHDVPISPVNDPNVACDQGDFVTIGDRCYEVLKPSFCDIN